MRYFPSIVSTPLEMMGSVLSVNMSSYEKRCTMEELSTMNVDTSESNPTCSEYSTIEESMWNILPFEILQKTKGLFLVWTFGGFFIALQLGLLEILFSLLVMHFPFKFSCWHPYPFELESEQPGEPM